MKTADMQKMYDYHYWANKQVLTASKSISAEQFAVSNGSSYGSLRALLVHILNTECLWRTLSQHNSIANYVELVETDFPTVDVLEQRYAQEERTTREYLAQLTEADLEGQIQSTNSEGEKWEPVRWHALWNIVNHATEHRSAASAILTGLGHPPGELDVAEYMNVVG